MPAPKVTSDQDLYHFLFVMTAEEGLIQKDKEFTLTLKNVDAKVSYMTARPGRDRAFIPADKFLRTWINNNQEFTQNPPEIAIIHSNMKTDAHSISQAIPIILWDPVANGHNSWKFKLKMQTEKLMAGSYLGITLFIDWLPALKCPEPIRLELPSLFS